MTPPRKRLFSDEDSSSSSTHSQEVVPPSTPAMTTTLPRARRGRPARGRARRFTSSIPLNRSPPSSPHHQTTSTPTVQPSSAITAPDSATHSLRPSIHFPNPSLLTSLQNEKEALTNSLNEHKLALKNAQTKVEEQAICVKALTSANKSLEQELSLLRSENESLKQLNEELMQKALSTPKKRSGKKLERLSATLPTAMLGIAMKVDQRLLPWLSREVSELCTQGDHLARNWTNRSEHSNDQAIQTHLQHSIVPLPPLALSSRPEHYTPSISSHTSLLAAIITAEVHTEHWSAVFPTDSTKSNVISTLSNSPVLLKIVRQAISDISSTRKRAARDSFFQALHYTHLLSRYHPFTPADFEATRHELQSAKTNLLKKTTDGTYDFSWWRCAPLSILNPSPATPFPPSPPTPTSASQSGPQVLETIPSDEEMIIFRHDAGPAVYQAFIGFNPLSEANTPVDVTVLALARLDAWIASVVELLAETDSRGGRRQKDYADTFGKFLHLATRQLIGSVRQFAEYWHPEEFDVDSENESISARKSFVINMPRTATRVLTLPSVSKTYLAIRADWFNKYVSKMLGHIHDCYIAEFAEDFKSINRHGFNGPWSSLPPAVIDYFSEQHVHS